MEVHLRFFIVMQILFDLHTGLASQGQHPNIKQISFGPSEILSDLWNPANSVPYR